MRARIATITLALLAAPLAAHAAPTNSFPLANPTFDGSETLVGNQDNNTVLITPAQIQSVLLAATNAWTAPQTFPAPSASKGSIVLTPGTISGTPPNGSLWGTAAGLFGEFGGQTQQFAPLNLSGSWSAKQNFLASTTATAGVNLGQGTGPTSPVNGDIWITSSGAFARVNGATAALGVTVPTAAAAGSSTQVQYNCSSVLCGYSGLTISGTTATFGGTLATPDGGSFAAAGVTLGKATTVNGTTTIKDSTGSNTVGTFSWAGGTTPTWTLPFPGVLKMAGAGLSPDAGSGATVDVGNGTAGDKSGTLSAATLTASSAINGPSGAGLQTNLWNTTTARFGQLVDLVGPRGTLAAPASGHGFIQLGGVESGSGGTLGLSFMGSAPAAAGGYCDQYAAYCTGRQIDFLSNDLFPVFGMEAGASDFHSLEIGVVRNADSMSHVAQLFHLDSVGANGSILHYNITAAGSGYTAPTAAFVSTAGCTIVPSTPVVQMSGTAPNGVVVGLSSPNPGAGCPALSVTISDSTGTGATATVAMNTTTDAMQGPNDIWEQLGTSGGGSQYGFGPCDVTNLRNLCFGEVANTERAWETTPALQPTFGTAGHIKFGVANGVGNNGFTWGEQLSDAGGGVLQVQNAGLTSGAGVKVGFLRVIPTTVAGLATADPSPSDGDEAYVTDATAPTFNGTLTGGGSVHTRVHYDGSASVWKAG